MRLIERKTESGDARQDGGHKEDRIDSIQALSREESIQNHQAGSDSDQADHHVQKSVRRKGHAENHVVSPLRIRNHPAMGRDRIMPERGGAAIATFPSPPETYAALAAGATLAPARMPPSWCSRPAALSNPMWSNVPAPT